MGSLCRRVSTSTDQTIMRHCYLNVTNAQQCSTGVRLLRTASRSRSLITCRRTLQAIQHGFPRRGEGSYCAGAICSWPPSPAYVLWCRDSARRSTPDAVSAMRRRPLPRSWTQVIFIRRCGFWPRWPPTISSPPSRVRPTRSCTTITLDRQSLAVQINSPRRSRTSLTPRQPWAPRRASSTRQLVSALHRTRSNPAPSARLSSKA